MATLHSALCRGVIAQWGYQWGYQATSKFLICLLDNSTEQPRLIDEANGNNSKNCGRRLQSVDSAEAARVSSTISLSLVG